MARADLKKEKNGKVVIGLWLNRARLLFFVFQGVKDYVKKEEFRAEGAWKISDVEFCRKMRASVGEGLKALQL